MRGRKPLDRMRSIKNFSDAGVGMGKVHRERAYEEFEQSGESGYSEGWAAGYSAAMDIINEFVSREYAEAQADAEAA